MEHSDSMSAPDGVQISSEVGRLGRWALRLAPVAILLELFASTSREPLFFYGGLILAVIAAIGVFLLSAFTLAKKDPPVNGIWRTVFLIFVLASVAGGLVMFRLLIRGLEASGVVV